MSPSSDESEGSKLVKNQAKVLIIDDERLLRQSLKKILQKAGFYVETAFDYQTAKKNIENLQYDLMLVDIVLPKMSGIELISKLQTEFDITSAIIFITGEPNLNTCIQAMRVGAIDYLEKPVSRTVLIESIKRSLIHWKREVEIIQNDQMKPIALDASFLNSTKDSMGEEFLQDFEKDLSETHDALLQLKKKFATGFNEDQRNLLNIIAQSNTRMRKLLNKMNL